MNAPAAPSRSPAQLLERICPTCGQKQPAQYRERILPLVFDAQGVPMEAAVDEGYGVPVLGPGGGHDLVVTLDGGPVEMVIAYSRPDGWVVRYQTDGRGQVVCNGHGCLTERLRGEVKVRRRSVLP